MTKTAILKIDAAINQAICAIVPRDSTFIPEYMQQYFIYIRPILLSRYVRIQSDAGRTNLYLGTLRTISVPLPSIEEQRQILYILQTVDRKIEIAKKKKEALQDLFKTMLHKLMTAQIRVKDLEIPAEKLLVI